MSSLIIRVFPALIFLFLLQGCTSEDQDHTKIKNEVSSVFTGYLEAFSNSQFLEAAQFVQPEQLDEMREYTLPILVEARNANQNRDNPILKVFFEGVAEDKINDLSGAEVSAGINRALTRLTPGLLEATNVENISITDIQVSEKDHATVAYETVFRGNLKKSEQEFVKQKETWYLVLTVPPKQQANQLRKVFMGP